MDDGQRKTISLVKERDEEKTRVREAYPVYSRNTSQSELEQQEFRNSPQPSYERYIEDPLPGQNRYADAQPQHAASGDDDLSGYCNYEVPGMNMQMPRTAPQITQPPVQRTAQPVQQTYQQPVQQTYQQPMKYCKFCGKQIASDAVICTHCGRQVEELKYTSGNPQVNVNVNTGNTPVQRTVRGGKVSAKSKNTAILLASAGFIGIPGLHHFYSGNIGTGILYLFTGGLFYIGTIVDIINLASGKFRDSNGDYLQK